MKPWGNYTAPEMLDAGGMGVVAKRLLEAKLLNGDQVTVCLPLIRPIGSRRTPAVFVMESTHAWHLHHPALARRRRTPRLGPIFGQR